MNFPWSRAESPDQLQRFAAGMCARSDMGEGYARVGGRSHSWMEVVGPGLYQTHYYVTQMFQQRATPGGPPAPPPPPPPPPPPAQPQQGGHHTETIDERIRRELGESRGKEPPPPGPQ